MNRKFDFCERKESPYAFAYAIIVIAFFLICRCGFFWNDDYWMGVGGSLSFRNVFVMTRDFYLSWGGTWLSTFFQYLLCGLLWGNKLWFDTANTIMFVCLLIVCSRLINIERKGVNWRGVLLFSLLFWFLCPKPKETLFWVVGSTAHMWTTALSYLFLLLFFKNENKDSSVWKKVWMFCISSFLATSIIPAVSICGAFVVYYLFHFKKFKGNVVFLVAGFIVGSVVLVFAPGNFARASENMPSFVDNMKDLIAHPFEEALKYKAFWLFSFAWLAMFFMNRKAALVWIRKNAILFMALGWSIIAFSIVFRPANRALVFTETMSSVLLLRLVHYAQFDEKLLMSNVYQKACAFLHPKRIVIVLLFCVFLLDAGMAIKETRRQSKNNTRALETIAKANGFCPVDAFPSMHRMALEPAYPEWTWDGLAGQLGLDSVHVYPYFCLEKYYSDSLCDGRVYVDQLGLFAYGDYSLRHIGVIFVRNNNKEEIECPPITLKVDYSLPSRWYYKLVNRLLGYELDRSRVVTLECPDLQYGENDYYYALTLKKKNLKGLTKIEIVNN